VFVRPQFIRREADFVKRAPEPITRTGVVTLFDELRINGFIEGQNLTVIAGGFGTPNDQLAGVAASLVAASPDVIFADSNGVHGLATPCVANLLRVTVRNLLLSVGSMHDVIAAVDRVIERLLQFLFVPL
jgi:hypothetical protein